MSYFVAWLCVPMLSIPLFMHVFRFRFTDIHAFTWSRIYCHFSYITCHFLYRMPGPHHLIMYTCACYARHLALFYVLAGVANNPGFSCPDPGVWTLALLYLIRVAQRERGLAVACPDPLPSRLFLIGSRDFHLATREYFPVFHIVHPAFVLLSDHIFFRYYIMPCDNCVLVLLLLDCVLPLCFRTLILACTDA